MGLFQGKHEGQIDGRDRIAMPASFRRILENQDLNFNETRKATLSLIHLPGEKSLHAYSVQGMAEYVEALIGDLPRNSRKRMQLVSELGARSYELQLDNTGRVVLPGKLAEAVGIKTTYFIVGALDHIEIWSREAFDIDRARYTEDEAAKLFFHDET